MSKIKIVIEDKRPSVVGTPIIVCGNSGYVIEFSFDDEWANLTSRVARFVYVQAGAIKYKDVAFIGNTVQVPILSGILEVMVGVYAGELRTTTPARIPCEYSILCGNAEEHFTEVDQATLQAQIGDLSGLETEDKSSLVAAINWLYSSAGLSEDEVNNLIDAKQATLQAQIGDLTGLETEDKSSLVAAINWLFWNAGLSEDEVNSLIDAKQVATPLCVTLNTGAMTADKTYTEINTARSAGRLVLVNSAGKMWVYDGYDPGGVYFAPIYTARTSDNNRIKVTRSDVWSYLDYTFPTAVLPMDDIAEAVASRFTNVAEEGA